MLTLYAITDAKPKGFRALRIGRAWVVIGRGARSATPASLRAYDRVVRRIASAVPAVLPFRFGSVARDEDDVAALLAPLGPSILGALDRTRGSVQFTLRVYGERTKAKPKRSTVKGGPGTRWLSARRDALRVPEIDVVTERTRPYVRETKSERHTVDRHLATVYHLVPRTAVREWRAAFEEASLLLEGVTIKTSGPWPPYAFAELP